MQTTQLEKDIDWFVLNLGELRAFCCLGVTWPAWLTGWKVYQGPVSEQLHHYKQFTSFTHTLSSCTPIPHPLCLNILFWLRKYLHWWICFQAVTPQSDWNPSKERIALFTSLFFYKSKQICLSIMGRLWVLAVLAYRSLCKRISIWYLTMVHGHKLCCSYALTVFLRTQPLSSPSIVKGKQRQEFLSGPGSIPGQGTKIPQATQCGQKQKPTRKLKKEEEEKQRQGQWKWHTYQKSTFCSPL